MSRPSTVTATWSWWTPRRCGQRTPRQGRARRSPSPTTKTGSFQRCSSEGTRSSWYSRTHWRPKKTRSDLRGPALLPSVVCLSYCNHPFFVKPTSFSQVQLHNNVRISIHLELKWQGFNSDIKMCLTCSPRYPNSGTI